MSWMTDIIHELMTFIWDTCRLYHTGKLWKKHSAITVNVRSSIKTIILISKSLEKSPWVSDPTPLEIAFSWTPFPLEFLMPSVGGSRSHPGMEGNSFHFLMNLCRYTCNSSWSHCKFFLKLFKQFIIVKHTCIFCWH